MFRVDGALMWPNGKAYLFSDDQYWRYDVAADRADPGYPKPIGPHWPGLGDIPRIQGAVVWPNGKAYFFSRDLYYRYDIASDRVDPGFPMAIKPNWPGLMIFGSTEINSATLWPDGFAYFFCDNNTYYKWNVAADKVEPNFPQPVNQQTWPGLVPPFNAVLVWPGAPGSQKAYFLRSTLYMRYDVSAGVMDPGYPLPISGNWPGLP